MILTALFAALTAIGAFISIPMPFVPVTMQTVFVSFAAIFLGPRYGALSQIVYISIGLLGIPVFTKGGGPSYIFQPSFGFLIGFVFAAYTMGRLMEIFQEPSFKNIFICALCGQIVIYAAGMPYLYFINNMYLNIPITFSKLIYSAFALFAVSGMFSVITVSVVSTTVYKRMKHLVYSPKN